MKFTNEQDMKKHILELERDLSRGEYAENNIPQICSHKLF